MAIRYIPIEAITPESFKPFGYVIGMPEQPPLAHNEERSFWASPGLELLNGAFKAVYVEIRMTDYVVRRLHRHRAFAQTLIPLGGKPFIHVVAPPNDIPQLSQMRAFLIDGTNAVITARNVWHRNPAYPLAREASLVLISRDATVTAAGTTDVAHATGNDTDSVELDSLAPDEFRLLL